VLYVISDKGLQEYVPAEHALKEMAAGDMKQKLAAVGGHGPMRQAPVVFMIVMDVDKARSKLGETAEKSSDLEAGHVAQNILLEATSMHLAGVPATGFDAAKVAEAMGLPANRQLIYLIPVGEPK
jgi:SagB-type dehydrogenase family enzyme